MSGLYFCCFFIFAVFTSLMHMQKSISVWFGLVWIFNKSPMHSLWPYAKPYLENFVVNFTNFEQSVI